MNTFILYSTLTCHLCEQAEAMLQFYQQRHSLSWRIVDIAEDDDLAEAYKLRIPVLKHEQSSEELGWPFEYERMCQWLSDHQAS